VSGKKELQGLSYRGLGRWSQLNSTYCMLHTSRLDAVLCCALRNRGRRARGKEVIAGVDTDCSAGIRSWTDARGHVFCFFSNT